MRDRAKERCDCGKTEGDAVIANCGRHNAPVTADRIGPFMLVQDDSNHWYVIPTATLGRWTAWLDSEAAQLGDVPDYAERVGGSPALVQFTEYKIV